MQACGSFPASSFRLTCIKILRIVDGIAHGVKHVSNDKHPDLASQREVRPEHLVSQRQHRG